MDKKTSNDYLLASGGYLIVALLSSFSGYGIALYIKKGSSNLLNFFDKNIHFSLEFINELISVGIFVSFVILILPYLINREVLLEREKIADLSNHEIRTTSNQIPMYIFGSLLFIYTLAIYILFLKNLITFDYLYSIIYLFIIGLSPFLFLYIRSIYLLKNNEFDQAYSFLESILLPALYVCVIPFSIGVTIIEKSIDLKFIGIVSAYLISLSILVVVFKSISNPKYFLYYSLYTIFFLTLLYFYDIDYFKFLLISLTLTLVLGVSEVTKRIFFLSNNYNHERYISQINGEKENYKFYLDSGKLVGISVPFLFPLISLLWDELLTKIFFIIASLQIIHWITIIKRNNIINIDRWIALLLGFLPLVVIIAQYYFNTEFMDIMAIDSNSSFVVELFIAFIALISVFFFRKESSEVYAYYIKFMVFFSFYLFVLFSYTVIGIISSSIFLKLLILSGYLIIVISIIVNWDKIKNIFKSKIDEK